MPAATPRPPRAARRRPARVRAAPCSAPSRRSGRSPSPRRSPSSGCPSVRSAARELVEREPRQLDDHVVERRLEGRHRRAGDDVRDLGQPPADRDLRRDPRDRVAGRLRRQRRRAATRGLTSMTAYSVESGDERELDVAAALDAERPDDRQRSAAQALVDRSAASGPARPRSNRRCRRRAGRRSPSSTRRCTCRRRRA